MGEVDNGIPVFTLRVWVGELNWDPLLNEREGNSAVGNTRVPTNDFSARFDWRKNAPTVPRPSTTAEFVANFLPWALFCNSMFGRSKRSTKLRSCCWA